jgi:hypothetical protein
VAGYSGTPTVTKLGIEEGHRVFVCAMALRGRSRCRGGPVHGADRDLVALSGARRLRVRRDLVVSLMTALDDEALDRADDHGTALLPLMPRRVG